VNNWDDLLLTGGFAPRARLLRGLTLLDVSARPHGVPHSIYEELWHAAMCQNILLAGGVSALSSWPLDDHFPKSPAPASQAEWNDLVTLFLADSERAVHQAEDAGWLESLESADTDWTWRNGLEFLAMHTAYHLGKIVLLRQMMKLWPPNDA
jgi:hypothetical protein